MPSFVHALYSAWTELKSSLAEYWRWGVVRLRASQTSSATTDAAADAPSASVRGLASAAATCSAGTPIRAMPRPERAAGCAWGRAAAPAQLGARRASGSALALKASADAARPSARAATSQMRTMMACVIYERTHRGKASSFLKIARQSTRVGRAARVARLRTHCLVAAYVPSAACVSGGTVRVVAAQWQ